MSALGTFSPGVFWPGGFCPGSFARGDFFPGGLLPGGIFVREGFCPGGGAFVRGVFCPGGLCPFPQFQWVYAPSRLSVPSMIYVYPAGGRIQLTYQELDGQNKQKNRQTKNTNSAP